MVVKVLRMRHWHVWPQEYPADWRRPDRLLEAVDPPAIATWRSDSPFGVIRATLGSLHDGFERRLLNELRIEVSRARGEEALRRRVKAQTEAEHHRAFVDRGFKGFANPVRGFCSCCTLPLRDPVSLARGIGPDCWDNFYREFPEYVTTMRRADVPTEYWLGATQFAPFQDRLREAIAALSTS
jgi:hypothetical protein